MSTNSKKRRLHSIGGAFNDNPPLKKHKSMKISSNLFPNVMDQCKFQQIYQAIDATELFTHCITKEVAEYATGMVIQCGNKRCSKNIHILDSEVEEYDPDHHKSDILGFKCCFISNKYFCNECMDNVLHCNCDECDILCECDCMALKYNADCETCNDCNSFVMGSNCLCCCGIICDAINCNKNLCIHCYQQLWCNQCNKKMNVCNNCFIIISEIHNFFCNECYDDTVIKCKKCNGKFPKKFKNNEYLRNGRYEMIKCHQNGCDTWICFRCKDILEEINGKYAYCTETNCNNIAGVFCDEHQAPQMYVCQDCVDSLIGVYLQ